MQNSKKTILIFASIILILLIIAISLISQGNTTDRVINLYEKLLKSDEFSFQMEEINSEYDYKMKVSQKGNSINIDTYSGDDFSSTLVLEDKVYVIMHNIQEYYIIDSEDVDGDFIISGLKEISKQDYSRGREEINGKQYYYEEYEGISNFLLLVHETEDAKITTRFYFDNDDLVFIKNKLIDEDEEQEELIKITVNFEVDDEVFKIPNDYAEM